MPAQHEVIASVKELLQKAELAEHAGSIGDESSMAEYDVFEIVQQASRFLEDMQENEDDMEEDMSDIPYGWTATEEGVSSYFVVFLSLLAFVLILSKMLHDRPGLQTYLPEAGMTILVGNLASLLIWLFAPMLLENTDEESEIEDRAAGVKGLLSFSSTFFFTVLLPPIIFNSGYHVNRLFFFRHLRPIILYACVGTFINICVVATLLHVAVMFNLTGGFKPHLSELLVFGSLISSTDPVSTLAVFQKKRVDPQLFYLVFGESVLNDGVCLVLFNAFSKVVGHEEEFDSPFHSAARILADFLFSFSVSLMLGVLSGIGAGFIFKSVDMRKTRLLELSLYVLVMYLPFFLADAVGLSGIVTILFTGIAAKRYAEPNLSVDTETESDVLFRVTAHLAETAIFLELGLSVFGLGLSSFNDFYVSFLLWGLLACLVGRAASIYPITLLTNMLVSRDYQKNNPPVEVEDLDMDGTAMYVHMPTQNEKQLKVSSKTAHMLWFSGLRGAVAYACAKTFPDAHDNQRTFEHITMAICLITVFVFGGATECFLNRLGIDIGVDEDEYMKRQVAQERGGALKRIDDGYICPVVIRDFRVEPDLQEKQQQVLESISESARDLMKASSVEMTIGDHERIMRSMARELSYSMVRKSSLYDFGASTAVDPQWDNSHQAWEHRSKPVSPIRESR